MGGASVNSSPLLAQGDDPMFMATGSVGEVDDSESFLGGRVRRRFICRIVTCSAITVVIAAVSALLFIGHLKKPQGSGVPVTVSL